jgi:hypothetical protein
MLMVIPDPDKVTSMDPQEIPDLGVFPIAVSDTGRTRQEWEKLIKQTKAPLVVRDVRSEEKLDALTNDPKLEEE